MKKIRRALILFLVLALFAMMALGSGSSDSDSSSSKSLTDTSEEGDSVSSDSAADSTDEDSDGNIEETVEEVVLYDDNDIIITATGLDDGSYGPELKLLIENNTDTDLTFQVRNEAINGYMVDATFSSDVAAGKKTNATVKFTSSELQACGIDTIISVEFYFHIFTTDDTYLNTEVVRVETTAAGTYTQEYDDSGIVLYDADGIKIVGKELTEDYSSSGTSLILYIEDNTEADICVQARDTSLNGFMVDTICSQDITAGNKALTAITVYSSYLDEIGVESIDDITEIETSFHIYDTNTDDTIVNTDPVVISFGTVYEEAQNTEAELENDAGDESAEEVTTGQKNALREAESYLAAMPFSYSGLISQLEFEGYSTEEATYAADNCEADWFEQAALCAENYLEYMAFSKSGLIEQLEFEGFTTEQATYGAEQNGY